MNTSKRIDATFTGEVTTDMEEVIYEGHEVTPCNSRRLVSASRINP